MEAVETTRVQISVDAFRDELAEIQERRRALGEEDGRLARRAAWLRQGIAYAEGGNADVSVQEMVPPDAVFADGRTKPTIRQAIVLAMKGSAPERVWRPAEVIEELGRLDWLPEAKTAHQMVRNRMLAMVERGELEKRDPGGYYRLADDDVRNTGDKDLPKNPNKP
jgi:hypothetical protein